MRSIPIRVRFGQLVSGLGSCLGQIIGVESVFLGLYISCIESGSGWIQFRSVMFEDLLNINHHWSHIQFWVGFE